jgi:hypothetical protein
MSTTINSTVKKDVRYLGKDFNAFKQNLINFTKTYFSNTFNSFDENDPGLLFLELASNVGDVLSFYLDTQLKEMLILQAEEQKNIIQLAQGLGYKPRITSPSITDLDVFQLVPSIGSGPTIRPDYSYALRINPEMQLSSVEDASIIFRTKTELDFAFSSSFNPTDVSVYSMDNGEPAFYLLKKSIRVESGTQKIMTIQVNNPEKYKKIVIPDTNIISIDSIVDSDGNDWTEVDYLAQDTVFEQVDNIQTNDPELYQFQQETPYLLKIKSVPKRFITRYNSDFSTTIQFGSGIVTDSDEIITPNLDNVGLTTPTGVNKLNYRWDIANFLYTTAYGEAPHNTTLTITYSVGGGLNTNIIPNVLKKIKEVSYNIDTTSLDINVVNYIKKSLACNNPNAATGGRSTQSNEEIRQNALAYFASQSRTVSRNDYVFRAMNMPQQFGSIAKAYIVQDEQLNVLDMQERIANPLSMNLYILTYNANKQLTNANDAIKENLKNYLNRFRMLTDSINIKDAYRISIQVYFTITVLQDYNSKEVLLKCTNVLKDYFDIDKWQINQPIVKADIIRLLANVKGTQSILSVDIINVFDSQLGYSENVYDIESATKNGIIYPPLDVSCFEIRFPDSDILGKAKNY